MKKAIVVLLLAILMTGFVFANPAQEAAATTKKTDSLVIGVNCNYTTLTPFNRHAGMSLAGWAIYEKLAYEADGVLTPWLAKEWTQTDKLHFTVKIWDSIYDTEGNHITASDVIFCYESFKAGGHANGSLVASMKAVDDYTIEFTLSDASIGNVELVLCLVNIVSKNAYEKSTDKMANQPISTSVFKVVDYVPSTYIALEKNENYWQKDASKIAPIANTDYKTLKFMNLQEPSTQTINLETSTINAFDGIDATQVGYFKEGGQYADKFTVLPSGGTGTYSLFFSGKSAIMQDKNLRLAIIYALDLDAIAKASGDLAEACKMFGPDVFSDHVDYYNGKYNRYNVEKAKEYLAKSNYKGEKLRFLGMIAFPNGNTAIEYYLNQIGINLEVNVPEGAVFGDTYGKPDQYDLAFCSHGSTSVANFWYKTYYKASGTQRHGWYDPELCAAVLEANDPDGHTKANMEKVSKMLDDRAYGVGLYIDGRSSVVANEYAPEHPFVLTRECAFEIPLWVK